MVVRNTFWAPLCSVWVARNIAKEVAIRGVAKGRLVLGNPVCALICSVLVWGWGLGCRENREKELPLGDLMGEGLG